MDEYGCMVIMDELILLAIQNTRDASVLAMSDFLNLMFCFCPLALTSCQPVR